MNSPEETENVPEITIPPVSLFLFRKSRWLPLITRFHKKTKMDKQLTMEGTGEEQSKKMEVDYSATVDEKIPKCEKLAKVISTTNNPMSLYKFECPVPVFNFALS